MSFILSCILPIQLLGCYSYNKRLSCKKNDKSDVLVSWGQILQFRFRGFPPVKSDAVNQYATITQKWCEIGHELVLFTNSKSHSIGTKIGDLEWPWMVQWPSEYIISHNVTAFGADCTKFTASVPIYCQQQRCIPRNLGFGSVWFMADDVRYLWGSWASCCLLF